MGCSTVAEARDAAVNEFGIPADELRLISCGLSLQEGFLAELGLMEDSVINAVLNMEGGGKKSKHKRKKVKLAVLKFYKVDGNGKVTKLRKECPNETCGPGVFMAMHYNRYYCGKCSLTYLIKKD